MTRKGLIISLAVMMLFALTAMAHFTWIRIYTGELRPGVEASAMISHGHDFPLIGVTPAFDETKVYVKDFRKDKTEQLKADRQSGFLGAPVVVPAEGVYAFYFITDRGVMSKTTRGWKPGGLDKYPKAIDSYKKYEASVAYVKSPKADWVNPKPLGFRLELVPLKISAGEVKLQLLLDGKPLAGKRIRLAMALKKPQIIGKTDDKGLISYQPAKGFHAELLFSATENIPAPKKYHTKRIQLLTSTLVDLRN